MRSLTNKYACGIVKVPYSYKRRPSIAKMEPKSEEEEAGSVDFGLYPRFYLRIEVR